jgi:hypothetical protein
VAAAAAVVLTPTMAQAAGSVNSSADHLVLWNDNIENMPVPACGMDFNKLFNYIKSRPTSPDVFTVQQISNVTQLNALTRRIVDVVGPVEVDGVGRAVGAAGLPGPDLPAGEGQLEGRLRGGTGRSGQHHAAGHHRRADRGGGEQGREPPLSAVGLVEPFILASSGS